MLHVGFAEPGWESTVAFLLGRVPKVMSVCSLVEAQAVLAGRTDEPAQVLDQLVAQLELEIVPFTVSQAKLARFAYLEYGKGQRHSAQLNFGDVMGYALAKERSERLVFVGDDFHQTDVRTIRLPLDLGPG